jgi:hypothetical protein
MSDPVPVQQVPTMFKRLLLLTIAIIAVLGMARSGLAAPPQQATNLLLNPGFEQPFANGRADNWIGWYKNTPKSDDSCLVAYHFQPKWNAETGNAALIRAGAASQYIGNNWDTWSGGVYQVVPATPGTTYRFTFYGRGRGTSDPAPAPSDTTLDINMRAGIDPNGGALYNDGDVVWGQAGSPHDQWQPFTVETVATGNQITVFTYADWAVTGVNQCRQFLDTWYDSAELIAVAQTPTETPPPPTAAPAQPTATPVPQLIPTEAVAATVVATLTAQPAETATPAGTATICVNAFLDENGNGLHEATESFVAGVTLTVAQGFTIFGQGVSLGTDQPLCFGGLQPGTYQVAQTVPATLEMTTQANATVQVGDGQTAGLEFGSRPRTEPPTAAPSPTAETVLPTATSTPTGGDSGSNAPGWLAVVGFLAIAGGLALLGVLIYLLLRK